MQAHLSGHSQALLLRRSSNHTRRYLFGLLCRKGGCSLRELLWRSQLSCSCNIPAMLRVTIVPIVSNLPSCWTSRVAHTTPHPPCRASRAVSQNRVSRVRGKLHAGEQPCLPCSHVCRVAVFAMCLELPLHDTLFVVPFQPCHVGRRVRRGRVRRAVSAVLAFETVLSVSRRLFQPCQLFSVRSCCE